MAQLIKNPPYSAGDLSLGWEDPLEKEWLTTPIFWPGEFYTVHGVTESDMTEHRHTQVTVSFFHLE